MSILRSLIPFSFLLVGCTVPNYDDINLDHYGALENTELEIMIEGDLDSCTIQIQNGQPLQGLESIDTTLFFEGSRTSLSQKITLERPSIVLLTVNEMQREVFLVPDCNNDLHITLQRNAMKLHFQDDDIRNINHYYQQKAKIGGDMFLRKLMTSSVARPTLSQAVDSIQGVESRLNQLLQASKLSFELPDWFVSFEEKNIEYLRIMLQAGAPRVRMLVFGMKDSLRREAKNKSLAFDLNDELALTTPHFLSSLPFFLTADSNGIKIDDIDPVRHLSLSFQKSSLIQSERVQDVFRSYLFHRISRASTHYPDSLTHLIKATVSTSMKSYLSRVEEKYLQLNGLPAPPIHLKDTRGNLVSLRDFRGNLVLVDFWFVGCKFCRLEHPFIEKLIDEFRDQDFKVIQICMKSDPESWKDLKDDLVGTALYSNTYWDRRLAKTYKINGYPRYVLIDKEGIVLEGWCERPSDPMMRKRIIDYFSGVGPDEI